MIGWSLGQPILPALPYPPYQLVYLTPPQRLYQVIEPAQPVLNNRVSEVNSGDDTVDVAQANDDENEEQYEVSQFHSEDDNGRVVFGFHSPDQIRMEARDSDGIVRGSYSYIDANGNIVRMHYWDDGSGFHAAGNNLPVAVHQVPEYTPEVQAARDQHFRLYEATLASLQAAMDQSSEENSDKKKDEDYAEQPVYSDLDHDLDNPSDHTVIIENGVPKPDRPEYSKIPLFVQANQFLDQTFDDDKESISIDNPDFRSQVPQWVIRQGKSDAESHYEGSKGEKKPDVKLVKTENPISLEKKIDIKPNAKGEYNPQTKEITGGKRAFYYHFKHLIPLNKGLVDHAPSDTAAKAKQAGDIPVAAVQDSQSSWQISSVPNLQVYPVYHPEQNSEERNE